MLSWNLDIEQNRHDIVCNCHDKGRIADLQLGFFQEVDSLVIQLMSHSSKANWFQSWPVVHAFELGRSVPSIFSSTAILLKIAMASGRCCKHAVYSLPAHETYFDLRSKNESAYDY